MISTIVASASQAMHFNAYFLAYILAGLSYTQITLTTDQIAYSSNVHIAHCTRKSWRNCSACMRFSLFLMCSRSLSESHLGVRINWMMFNGTFLIVFFLLLLMLWYIEILFERIHALLKLKFKSNLINIHWYSLTYHSNEYGFHSELEIMLTIFNLRISLWMTAFPHGSCNFFCYLSRKFALRK